MKVGSEFGDDVKKLNYDLDIILLYVGMMFNFSYLNLYDNNLIEVWFLDVVCSSLFWYFIMFFFLKMGFDGGVFGIREGGMFGFNDILVKLLFFFLELD